MFGGTAIGSKVVCRARFEKILHNLHFADNNSYDSKNRLYKISDFLGLLNESFQIAFCPGKQVCVNESNSGNISLITDIAMGLNFLNWSHLVDTPTKYKCMREKTLRELGV